MSGRILIAGTGSGCGKTGVTLALLGAFTGRGMKAVPFKCGPDYIDPMFHRAAAGCYGGNLDLYLGEREKLRALLAENNGEGAVSVIEGVMGYYDGIGKAGQASSYEVAAATDTPAILVMSARGMYSSVGAVLRGFCRYKEDSRIRGVIFNGIGAGMYERLKEVAEEEGLLPLGFLPEDERLCIKSRHLGLVTAEEIPELPKKLKLLSEYAKRYMDLPGILRLAESAPVLKKNSRMIGRKRVRVAVARDAAFCFLYEENLKALESAGAEICYFSPLEDSALPEETDGLYLPGGYPELYLKKLSGQHSLLTEIRRKAEAGLPLIAECGGFLYLHERVDGIPLCGVIQGQAERKEKLQRFGYARLRAEGDSLLFRKDEEIPVHEFHYYGSSDPGTDLLCTRAAGGQSYGNVHVSASMYAGFPHLYFPGKTELAERFCDACEQYKKDRKRNV